MSLRNNSLLENVGLSHVTVDGTRSCHRHVNTQIAASLYIWFRPPQTEINFIISTEFYGLCFPLDAEEMSFFHLAL